MGALWERSNLSHLGESRKKARKPWWLRAL